MLGLLTACWSFTGYDASAHLIEETKTADSTAGWPILYAIGASFVVGLMYLLSLTVCIQVRHASLWMTTSFLETFISIACMQPTLHVCSAHLCPVLFPITSPSAFLPITLSAAVAHLIVTLFIQDLTDLTDPTVSLSGSYVAQIIWDVFESRYGYGQPSLLLMLVPLGAMFFCGMSSITSASRCPKSRLNIMDCQGKHRCIDINLSFRCST